MKNAIWLLILFLPMLTTAQSLAEYEHIVVVGERAPAADVVIAANFAASMKASTGTVYKSALDSQLDELSSAQRDERTIIVIDGKKNTAQIIGKNDLAAQKYLEEQGFDVKLVDSTDEETNEDDAPAISDDAENEVAEESIPSHAVKVIPVQDQNTIKEIPVVETTDMNEDTYVTEPLPEEKGFWARVGEWFAELF